MRGNMGNLLKQAQAIKENVEKAQAEVASIEVVGESGGGMVKVTMSGRHEVKKVQIEPAVAADDRDNGGFGRRRGVPSARRFLSESPTRRCPVSRHSRILSGGCHDPAFERFRDQD